MSTINDIMGSSELDRQLTQELEKIFGTRSQRQSKKRSTSHSQNSKKEMIIKDKKKLCSEIKDIKSKIVDHQKELKNLGKELQKKKKKLSQLKEKMLRSKSKSKKM